MEDIESVEEVNEEVEQTEEPVKTAPAKPGALYSNPARNLTAESIRAWGRSRKAQDLSKVKPGETVKIAVAKLDKNGNKVKDGNGFTVTEERTVLKHEKVSQEWDKRLGAE